jgi:hypothetical protein
MSSVYGMSKLSVFSINLVMNLVINLVINLVMPG